MKSNSSIVIILIICLSPLLCQDDIIIKEAVVNGSIILPCPCSANAEVVWSMVKPMKTEIAGCKSGACKIYPDFEKRFMIVDPNTGNFSLNISNVAYNDGGTYECSCDGKVHDVKLRVFDPQTVTANEGGSITLKCPNRAKVVKNVIWKANGKTVVQYSYESKSLTVDKDLEGRVTLDEGGFSGGDYSLHMTSVHQADSGLYWCFFQDDREGDPRSVQLVVIGKHPQPSTDTGHVLLYIALAVLGLIIIALVVAVIALVVRLNRVTRSKHPQPEPSCDVGSPVQEQSPMIQYAALKSSIVPIQDE